MAFPNVPYDDDDDFGSSSSSDNNSALHAAARAAEVSSAAVDDPASSWTAERLLQSTYKDLGSPTQVQARFLQFLLSNDDARQRQRRHQLYQLLAASSTTTRDYSIEVDAFDLSAHDAVLGHMLLRYPATLLPLLEQAVVQAQQHLLEHHYENGDTNNDNAPPVVGSPATWNVKGGGGGMMTDGNSSSRALTRVHARLVHLPPYCWQLRLGHLGAADVGQIWQVTGTVTRTGPTQMYESSRTYQCGGKRGCQGTFLVHADLEQRHNALVHPTTCPLLLGDGGGAGTRCPGNKFTPVDGASIHTDYQEVKIQEATCHLALGQMPRALLIKLQHDLVDRCQPGDQVVVVGRLLAQWPTTSLQPEQDCPIGLAMSAHSVRVLSEKGSSAWKQDNDAGQQEMEKFRKEFDAYWQKDESKCHPMLARDFICKAVCPKLYGLQVIKLALLMTLIGGVSADAYEHGDAVASDHDAFPAPNDDNDAPVPFQVDNLLREKQRGDNNNAAACYGDNYGPQQQYGATSTVAHEQVKTRRRDQSHLLLVGDAGQGKSQFLRFAAALCPRSVLTTGVGTTSAGLTCAAVREGSGKEFALEAGALVLADKGVCCIDEFGCIRKEDRTSILEAMEQQTISVAKAGIVCKLNCRATIIAVMNPRDCVYDNQASLATNTGLGTPLLSRFDLIFKMVDTADAERDHNVTTYLLNRAIQGAGFDVDNSAIDMSAMDEEPWSMEKLRAYISVVKEKFQPRMSDAAALVLERHYELCRSQPSHTTPVTVRFLESLIRLSQAHARLMYGNEVTLEDAVAALQVMECSAFAFGGFDGRGGADGGTEHGTTAAGMYVDPMATDFSLEADANFLCFQYRLLTRYNMIDAMNANDRRKALSTMNANATGWDHWQPHVQTGAPAIPAEQHWNPSWSAPDGVAYSSVPRSADANGWTRHEADSKRPRL